MEYIFEFVLLAEGFEWPVGKPSSRSEPKIFGALQIDRSRTAAQFKVTTIKPTLFVLLGEENLIVVTLIRSHLNQLRLVSE